MNLRVIFVAGLVCFVMGLVSFSVALSLLSLGFVMVLWIVG